MSISPGTTIPSEYNHKINNNDYIFKVTLVNAAGDYSTAQDIKPPNIQDFVIDDTINSFYQTGYIIINNARDKIERDTPAGSSTKDPAYYNNSGNSADTSTAGFVFRGEARDILRVEIMPHLDGTAVSNLGSDDAQKFFKIDYDFVIYDSEEIPSDDPDQKFKKLYFWDITYQLLLEKNVQFSTATIAQSAAATSSAAQPANGIQTTSLPSNADDSDRAIPTGLALREFLKAAFPPNEQYPIAFSQNIPGTQNTSGLSQNEIDQQNIDWDLGGTNLFFTSPANYKGIDSLYYILSRHVSNSQSNYDQCFLQLERYPREFTFKSLKQYFDQALGNNKDSPGSLYLETLKIGGNTQQDGRDASGTYFTPTNGLYFERIGTIKSFAFDSLPGLHSQRKLVPTFVHSYDYENKQFAIDIQRNGVEQMMKTYQENYVNNMLSSSKDPAFPSFAPGQLRYLNKNANNVFSVSNQDSNQRLAWGRNQFLYASIFANNLVSFRLPGSTHRQPGYFIGIDRDNSIPDSKFDNKLLGVYFIVQVSHSFSGNEYYNDLYCIKTYNYLQLDNTYTSEDADGNLVGLVSRGQ